MIRVRLVAAAAATLALLAGCGSDADDTTGTADEPAVSTPATSASAAVPADPPLPPCAEVWVVGKVLSEEFLGCLEDGNPVVKSLRCETGQELFTHAGRFFAIPGTPVDEASGALADDPRFQRVYRACTA